MAEKEVEPLSISPDVWQRTTKGNAAAVAIADRHYSRAKYGKHGGQVGPPGRLLVLMTADESALWITHWPDPKLALDGLDSWRCVMFRNEGTTLSSSLIVAAMARTAEMWEGAEPPRDGWVTWVDRAEVRSTSPGYCFMRAGWWADRAWVASTKARRTLLRLRADHVE